MVADNHVTTLLQTPQCTQYSITIMRYHIKVVDEFVEVTKMIFNTFLEKAAWKDKREVHDIHETHFLQNRKVCADRYDDCCEHELNVYHLIKQ